MPRKRKRQDQDGVYQRPDSPNWWYTYVDASGARVRRSAGTEDRKEAETILAAQKLDAYRARQWGERPKRGFEELMVAYLKATSRKRSAETDRYRVRALRRHLAGVVMHDLGAAQVRGYIAARHGEGAADGTINRELSLLSTAINYANAEWDWGLPNPVKGRKLAEPEGRVRWLSHEEAEALVAAAKGAVRSPFLADLITVALHTGCRRGELLGLEWRRVDLKHNVLLLEAAHTKGKRRRTVPLNQTARAALIQRARFRSEHCPATPWVFAFHDGRAAQDLRGAFSAACTAAGITDFTFHDLRHTCAAWLVTDGAPLAEIRDLLGHSTILMTERYAHLAPENLRATVRMLDASRSRHVAPGDPAAGQE